MTTPAPPAFPDVNVPIIGQRVSLKAFCPTVVITCHCSEIPEPVMIVGEAPGTCPKCRRGYLIGKITHEHGQPPQIVIGIVQAVAGPDS